MNRSEVIDLVTKSLETATKHGLACAYVEVVGCGDCPFWHDCSNETMCYDYIFKKLQEDKEGNDDQI